MGRRITRKQLKKDDEFVSAGEIVLRWITENLRPLLAAVAAVFVVAIVVGGQPVDRVRGPTRLR